VNQAPAEGACAADDENSATHGLQIGLFDDMATDDFSGQQQTALSYAEEPIPVARDAHKRSPICFTRDAELAYLFCGLRRVPPVAAQDRFAKAAL
jgi:hypothetical protein